ncbi:MAG TPA: hypothetical protein VGO50_04495 [Pyrinomonadaceae bacterium]|jgi:hypothetical protein|nr:hypothetical protein [Pyrinomonadaceae bacterium]
MKYLLTILFIGGCIVVTKGQTEIRTAQLADTKIYAELLASSEKVVKGAPFYAEVSNESVQTLSDGNRIVRTSNAKMYRDSEGRFRRDGAVNSGANTIGYYSGVMATTITDPVSGTKFILNDKDKTVRKWAIKLPFAFKGEEYEKLRTKLKELSTTDSKMSPQAMVELEKKLAVQGKMMTIVTTPSAQSPAAQAELEKALVGKIAVAATVPGGELTVLHSGEGSGYAFNTESLGTKNIEGVEAEGTRNVTTIPAGAIGNERPIEIVYEKWYSKDLQLIVYSRHSDPRYGDQVYKLTNISRSDPDPSVFTIPGDYKMQAEGYAPAAPRSAYRIATAATAPMVQVSVPAPAVTVKAPAAPKKAQ